MECRAAASVRFDVEGPDDVAPLLGFLSDELAKGRGRAGKNRAAQVGEPRLHLRIGKGRVDLLVELVDDLPILRVKGMTKGKMCACTENLGRVKTRRVLHVARLGPSKRPRITPRSLRLARYCARAASGHAAAAPLSSVMNSRRITRSPRRQWRVASQEPRSRAPSRS